MVLAVHVERMLWRCDPILAVAILKPLLHLMNFPGDILPPHWQSRRTSVRFDCGVLAWILSVIVLIVSLFLSEIFLV